MTAPIFKPDIDEALHGNLGHWSRDGLIGAWLFNEGGGCVLDYSDLRNIGNWSTFVGGMSYNANERGRVFVHGGNGTAARVDLGSIPGSNALSLSNGERPTILWRARLASGVLTNAFPRLIDKSNSGFAQNGWAVWYNEGIDDYQLVAHNGTNYSEASSTQTIVRNQYESWAVRVEDANDWRDARFFREGVGAAATQTETAVSPATTTVNAAIANWNHSTDRQWHGRIEYILVYNRPLSDDQIFYLQMVDPYVAFRKPAFVPAFVPAAAPVTFRPRVMMF